MKTATDLLQNFDTETELGIVDIDTTHKEFLELVENTTKLKGPSFASEFSRLLEHTIEHFKKEEDTMKQMGHGSLIEHISDHQRILGDMSRFNDKVQAGRTQMARAWLNDSLIDWFDTHVKTMDSAFVADLKSKDLEGFITEMA